MKESSVSRALLTGLLALIGLGDENKVENGNQSQTVIQPIKPVGAEAKTVQPVSEVSTVSEPQPQPVTQSHHVTSVPRKQSYASEDEYESEEDCVCICPTDEEEADEEEEEPELQVS